MTRKATRNQMEQIPSLLSEFYHPQTSYQKRQSLESQLSKLMLDKDFLLQILKSPASKNDVAAFFELNTVYTHAKSWYLLSSELKMLIFEFLQGYLLSNASPALLSLSIKALAEILKSEWPQNMNGFFPNVVSLIYQENALGWTILTITFEELLKEHNVIIQNSLMDILPSIISLSIEKMTLGKSSDSAYSSPIESNNVNQVMQFMDILFSSAPVEKFVTLELMSTISQLFMSQNQYAFHCVHELLNKQFTSSNLPQIMCGVLCEVNKCLESSFLLESESIDILLEIGGLCCKSYLYILPMEVQNQYFNHLLNFTVSKSNIALPIWHTLVECHTIAFISSDINNTYTDLFVHALNLIFDNITDIDEEVMDNVYSMVQLLASTTPQIETNLHQRLLTPVFFKCFCCLLPNVVHHEEFMKLCIYMLDNSNDTRIFDALAIACPLLASFQNSQSFYQKVLQKSCQSIISGKCTSSIINCLKTLPKNASFASDSLLVRCLQQSEKKIEKSERIDLFLLACQWDTPNAAIISSHVLTESNFYHYLSELFKMTSSWSLHQKSIVYEQFKDQMFTTIQQFTFGIDTIAFIQLISQFYCSFYRQIGQLDDFFTALLSHIRLEDDINYFEAICRMLNTILINKKNLHFAHHLIHHRAVNVHKSNILPLSFFELLNTTSKLISIDEMDDILVIFINEIDKHQIENFRYILSSLNECHFKYNSKLLEKLLSSYHYSEYNSLKEDILSLLWKIAQMSSQLFIHDIIQLNPLQKNDISVCFHKIETIYEFKQAMMATVLKSISISK